MIGYRLEDFAPTPEMRADIQSNPTGHGLSRVPTQQGDLYISREMGGQNPAYLDKVAEGVAADVGDSATAATVVLPNPLTAGIAFFARLAEFYLSDDKTKTAVEPAAGIAGGKVGKVAAQKSGVSAVGQTRSEILGGEAAERSVDAVWKE